MEFLTQQIRRVYQPQEYFDLLNKGLVRLKFLSTDIDALIIPRLLILLTRLLNFGPYSTPQKRRFMKDCVLALFVIPSDVNEPRDRLWHLKSDSNKRLTELAVDNFQTIIFEQRFDLIPSEEQQKIFRIRVLDEKERLKNEIAKNIKLHGPVNIWNNKDD